ncbi:hypothetical protein EV715DRAFT_298223 [Schizophyllum commune]
MAHNDGGRLSTSETRSSLLPDDTAVILQIGERRELYGRRQLRATPVHQLIEVFLASIGQDHQLCAFERYVFWMKSVRVIIRGHDGLLAVDIDSWDELLPQILQIHIIQSSETSTSGNRGFSRFILLSWVLAMLVLTIRYMVNFGVRLTASAFGGDQA